MSEGLGRMRALAKLDQAVGLIRCRRPTLGAKSLIPWSWGL